MTVCIAVTPRFSDTFVLVSDQLLSSDSASVEGAMKMGMIAPVGQWSAMFAGDPARFSPLMDRVREILGDVRETRLSLDTVTSALEKAYEIELQRRAETEILQPYGMGRDKFISHGRQSLGDARFNVVMEQITDLDLGIELLVTGLDGYAQPHLFTVSTRGHVDRSVLSYGAIGSGAATALGTFYQLDDFPGPDLQETIYRTCAAKFTAENVPSVGQQTWALIVSAMSGAWTPLMEIDRLREIWRREGKPPFPSSARRVVARELRQLDKVRAHMLRARGSRGKKTKAPEK